MNFGRAAFSAVGLVLRRILSFQTLTYDILSYPIRET